MQFLDAGLPSRYYYGILPYTTESLHTFPKCVLCTKQDVVLIKATKTNYIMRSDKITGYNQEDLPVPLRASRKQWQSHDGVEDQAWHCI